MYTQQPHLPTDQSMNQMQCAANEDPQLFFRQTPSLYLTYLDWHGCFYLFLAVYQRLYCGLQNASSELTGSFKLQGLASSPGPQRMTFKMERQCLQVEPLSPIFSAIDVFTFSFNRSVYRDASKPQPSLRSRIPSSASQVYSEPKPKTAISSFSDAPKVKHALYGRQTNTFGRPSCPEPWLFTTFIFLKTNVATTKTDSPLRRQFDVWLYGARRILDTTITGTFRTSPVVDIGPTNSTLPVLLLLLLLDFVPIDTHQLWHVTAIRAVGWVDVCGNRMLKSEGVSRSDDYGLYKGCFQASQRSLLKPEPPRSCLISLSQTLENVIPPGTTSLVEFVDSTTDKKALRSSRLCDYDIPNGSPLIFALVIELPRPRINPVW
ncbi:hypothetical protein BT96DRAFT_988623 [Gymnopus androsaceus JB14]|uniref:Uncharacterized protein n=1 Tax=Gymnopus androsaceus JB14 TaxID=1447944 RepID=A0A6A4I972_9AGAR|nr:hypothetical protein BT96DRAFT_988623 [Gymnopus androsaceus JB14]